MNDSPEPSAAIWLARTLLAGAAFALVGLVAINAWAGDDAAITARTIDNLLHGYGLR